MLQSPVGPTFAPEITDTVIDHLHDDIPTLAACGLTCRDWLQSSRYHLFSELKLDLNKAQSLVHIVQHPNGNNIRAVVQRLVLINLDRVSDYTGDDFEDGDDMDAKAAAAAQRNALTFLGTCLSSVEPVVKQVRLCSGARSLTIEAVLVLLSSMKSSVMHLEIIDMIFDHFSFALDIIYTFPRLDTLLMDGFSFEYESRPGWPLALDEVRPERVGQGPLSLLTILKCSDDSTQTVVNWALTRHPVPRIDIPVMNCEASKSRNASEKWRTIWLSPLISVENLRIKFVENLSLERGMLVDIRVCSNIRTLELCDIVPHPSEQTHALAAPMLLSQLTSTCVEHVILAFKYTTFVTCWMEFVDWEGVVAALTRSEFANLRTLTVRSGPWGQSRADALEAERLLRQGPLVAFHNRGVLEIEIDSPFL